MSLSGKFFRHYKGRYYYVFNISTHTETGQKLVNYIDIEDEIARIWSRPLSMWNDIIVNDDRRFVEIKPTQNQIRLVNKKIKKNRKFFLDDRS